MKQQIKDYFYFSKSEQKGVIALVLLLLIFLGVRFYLLDYNPKNEFEKKDLIALQFEIDSIETVSILAREREFKRSHQKVVLEVKDFEPNELSRKEWMEFGLSERQATTLLNYKNKIGGFDSKAEVKKVFVISDELYAQLSPHMLLPEFIPEIKSASKKWKKKKYSKSSRVYPKVDINTADTAALKKLYGIGEVLAERIVKRREELGGFISKDQLREIYGLKEEILIKLDTQLLLISMEIRKLNINSATKEELKAHPYLYWKQAKVIVNYRKQHGKYRKIDDLKKTLLINDSILEKVKPYIEL